jgi:Lysozyme like domain
MAIFLVVAVIGVAYFALTASGGGLFSSGSSDSADGGSGADTMPGTPLTQDQISNYAAEAGFVDPDLDTAVAVAMAESSGDPSAVGDLNVGGSYGLWQINLKYHPEYTADELSDPQTNANAAYAIYAAAGNTFQPWSTFNSGAYQAYL